MPETNFYLELFLHSHEVTQSIHLKTYENTEVNVKYYKLPLEANTKIATRGIPVVRIILKSSSSVVNIT